MKKQIVFIIVSLMVFNLTVSLFAKTAAFCDADISGFDDFAVEQVQKIFSSTLSDVENEQSSQNSQTSVNDFLFFCDMGFNLENSIVDKTDNLKLSSLFIKSSCINLFSDEFYAYCQCCYKNTGLTLYNIALNSYIAVVIFDTQAVDNI